MALLAPEGIPLLRDVAPNVRSDILRDALSYDMPQGSVVFEQGDIPAFQHIVLAGSVHLFGRTNEGREVLIEVVQPGELVIPAAVATASPYLMDARVLEPSRLLLIQADIFRTAIRDEPVLAMAVVDSLACQFRRMVRQIKNLKLRSAAQRVGCYILALSREQKNSEKVILPYGKSLIASELGMSRECFSRTLSALRRNGIAVDGDTITIVDAARLAEACWPDSLIYDDKGFASRIGSKEPAHGKLDL